MLIKEISELINSDIKTLMGQVKIVMLGSNVVCIQNFIKLLNYSNTEARFRVKNNELIVSGINLKIAELGSKEIILQGKINKLYYKKEAVNEQNELWYKGWRAKLWQII